MGRTRPVIISYPASPVRNQRALIYSGGEVDATTAAGIHGLADENEDIPFMVSREQAYQRVEEGKIDNAAAVIAMASVASSSIKTREKMKRYTPDFPEMMRLCETTPQLRRPLPRK